MEEIEKLGKWNYNEAELGFNFIHIVPNDNKQEDGYKLAYYLGEIDGVVKIIEEYDAGSIYNLELIQWDFENKWRGISIWAGKRKITSSCGRIEIVK